MDGFDVSEGYFAFCFGGCEGNVYSECDGEVIRYVEVMAGEVVYCGTSGADEVEDMAVSVGGKIYILSDIEAGEKVQEFNGRFGV